VTTALVPNLPPHYNQVTLRFPLRYGVPCMAGQWKRLADGRIEATFTKSEIDMLSALGLFDLVPVEFVDAPVSKRIWNPQPTASHRRRL
jgi:hypothetical protein